MNREHLGDALDFWKGGLFQYLKEEGSLKKIIVDPMITDPPWGEDDFRLYARLLKVKEEEQIIRHKELLDERKRYFNEISKEEDIFLDPDIGIAGKSLSSKHINFEEISDLLCSESRAVVVYQHIGRKKACNFVEEKILQIKNQHGSFCWCAYVAPIVAMCFFCKNGSRIEDIYVALTKLRGENSAKKRIDILRSE